MKASIITAVVTEENGWFVAEDTSSRVVSQGKTFEQALANLKEAVMAYFEEMHELPPSKPSKVVLATIEL